MMVFNNAEEAFEYMYDMILSEGELSNGTKYMSNVGFTILNPTDKNIKTPWRKWSLDYAEYEWEWYKSGNPNANEIAKRAKIWATCQDEMGNVNSNYGYQWNRGDRPQIEYVVNELKRNPQSRRAVISIYDGKENHLYSKDTPCTLAIYFNIENEKLNMSVMMRSNDLVYGFCNDQFCFAKLQEIIADELGIELGWYYHHVNNIHIYERHFNMKNKI